MSNENEKTESKTINREHVVKWGYAAGFPSNYVRGEVARFETFAKLVSTHLQKESDD